MGDLEVSGYPFASISAVEVRSSLKSHSLVIRCCQPDSTRDSPRALEITIEHTYGSTAASPIEAETESLRSVLCGHFYCDGCPTIDRRANLDYFLSEYSRTGSISQARAKIAGGLFALAVLDKQKSELRVLGDRLGCMPLYYCVNTDRIEISINSFDLRSSIEPAEDRVVEFLKYGYLPFADSLFPSIRRVHAGETLLIRSDPRLNLSVEVERYSPYPPPRERIRNLEEAAHNAIRALDTYFSRFAPGKYLIGLSGGYDSRLIAAYLAEFRPCLLNFGNPQSLEVSLAREVAERLHLTIESHRIPLDAVSRYAHKIGDWMPIMDDLEDAHVLWLVNQVRARKPEHYLDGFIGDTILGSCYYYKLGSNFRSLASNLLLQSDYESTLNDELFYVSALYDQGRSVSDATLGNAMAPDVPHRIRARIQPIIEESLNAALTHEDMIESLTHATRARSLIAGGPVGISLFVPCACPFIDHRILETGLGTAKKLRSGDRLYNAIWRLRFPELANIRRSATGGCPTDSDRVYRIKNLKTSVARRFAFPFLKKLTGGRIDKTEGYFSVDAYVLDERNASYLHSLFGQRLDVLPVRIRRTLREAFTHSQLDARVALRAASLVQYLDD